MRPTQPHHSLSNHYRRFGGLRELDFYAQNATRHWETNGENYKVAVLCNKDSQLALPFLALGMHVTATFDSDKDLDNAKEVALSTGLELNGIIGSFEHLPEKEFDAVVAPDMLPGDLALIKTKIKDHGRIFAKLDSRSMSLSEFRNASRDLGLRVFKSKNLGIIRNSDLKRNKYFHVADWMDGFFADWLPDIFSRAWLLEVFPSTDSPLVIQMLPTFLVGGAEIVAMNLAEKLPEHGFETMMLSMVGGGGLEPAMKSRGINYIKLERSPGYGRIKIFFELINILKNLKPRIIHTHLFASDTWGRLAAKLSGAGKVITTEHNVHCDFGFLGRIILTLMSGFSTAYVAVSDQVKKHMVRDFWIKPGKIKVIYNGIDLSRIRKRPMRPFQDVPRILFVGRLEEQKNPAMLLRALAQIERPWKLDLAGNGSLRDGLEKLANELGIAARVRFLGNVNTANLYAEYDVFAFPSLWEGLGLAAIEAAVAGLPIVASDIAPLKELFDEEEIAFVKTGDAAKLAEALRGVFNKPMHFIQRADELSRKDKWKKFSEENMSMAYAHVYRDLIGRDNPQAPYSAETIKTSTLLNV